MRAVKRQCCRLKIHLPALALFVLTTALIPYSIYAQDSSVDQAIAAADLSFISTDLPLDSTACPWSLAECIAYAQEMSLEMDVSRLAERSVQNQLTQAWWSFSPTIHASAGANISLGRAIDFGSNSVSNDLLSTNFSISASISLFQGLARIRTLQMAQVALKERQVSTDLVRYNTALSVANQFLQIVYQREVVNVQAQQLVMSNTRLQEYELLVRVGQKTEGELREVEAMVARDEQGVVNAENQLYISVVILRQLLMLDDTVRFNLLIPQLDSAHVPMLPSETPMQIYEIARNVHPAMVRAKLGTERTKLAVKQASSGYWPTLSLGAQYGSGTRHFLQKQEFIPEEDFGKQWKDNSSQGFYLNLQVPIFDARRTRSSVVAAKISHEQSILDLKREEVNLFQTVQRAYAASLTAYKHFLASRMSMLAEEQAFSWAESRQRHGDIGYFEYTNAKNKYAQSQIAYLQAKYDYVLKVKILRYYMGEPFEILNPVE